MDLLLEILQTVAQLGGAYILWRYYKQRKPR